MQIGFVRKLFLLATALIAISLNIHSQVLSPKFEFRGVWVATVNNIDWPSRQGLTVENMKKEALDLLDMHHRQGMNVIIFQVRPCSDALYYSELEPWSRYLTGTPGKAPDPFFDPLQFWIEESHKRGMELHAWLNPYRLAQNTSEPLAGNHIAFKNPDWVVSYGNKLYFDPGVPATRTHVARVVTDMVKRYDVDAIHFDDYFYPYPVSEPFPDDASFARYNRAFRPDQKDHWRRENVDILIKMLNDSIKSIKPWVKFGISPFGVWRNRNMDEEGSDTRAGVTNYDHLYADIRKWLHEGWIDYVIPQIYWEIGHPAADFETLVRWWNRNSNGKGLYIGHAPYKLDAASATEAWRKADQMPKQVDFIRKFNNVGGSAYFSSKQFRRDLFGFQDSLINRLYRLPSLTPPMPWLKVQKPATPVRIRTSGRRVHWQPSPVGSPMGHPVRYLIYLNEEGVPFDQQNPNFIVQYTELTAVQFNRRSGKRKTYEVRISALDRLNNESPVSAPVIVKL
jgi:uncharacterized lipoprotein YddW (UPF0748 family)